MRYCYFLVVILSELSMHGYEVQMHAAVVWAPSKDTTFKDMRATLNQFRGGQRCLIGVPLLPKTKEQPEGQSWVLLSYTKASIDPAASSAAADAPTRRATFKSQLVALASPASTPSPAIVDKGEKSAAGGAEPRMLLELKIISVKKGEKFDLQKIPASTFLPGGVYASTTPFEVPANNNEQFYIVTRQSKELQEDPEIVKKALYQIAHTIVAPDPQLGSFAQLAEKVQKSVCRPD